MVAETQGLYKHFSTSPRYANLWVGVFEGISVTVAMYCLAQFYIQLKDDLRPHRPLLKVLAVKVAIFLCFWQNALVAVLTTKRGPLKPTRFVARLDLRIGIPCILTCVEMAFFAVLHRWAFPWKPYDIDGMQRYPTKYYACGPNQALLEAIYPWDYAKAAARGFRWLFHGIRFRKTDPSYHTEPKSELKQEPIVRTRIGAKSDPGHMVSKKRKDNHWKTA